MCCLLACYFKSYPKRYEYFFVHILIENNATIIRIWNITNVNKTKKKDELGVSS